MKAPLPCLRPLAAIAAVALLMAGGLATSACASAAARSADNPDGLAQPELVRVSGLCQSVLGLSPDDRPVAGLWRGNPHLPAVVSHYQACVAALSDSLQQARAARNASEADASCRARGLAADSPALARCVLQRLHNRAAAGEAGVALPLADSAPPPARAHRSFYTSSPAELQRREQLACASLGFEPPAGEFSRCVSLLRDDFDAIDNPVD